MVWAIAVNKFVSILVLAAAIYLVFYKSYLTERGENIATKEDIGEITLKVESVKNDLSFMKERHMSIKILLTNAILDYYEKSIVALSNLSFAVILNLRIDSTSIYDEIDSNVTESIYLFDLATSRLRL